MGLRGYAQRDPLTEYKLEGYNLFLEMMANIRRNTIYNIYVFSVDQVHFAAAVMLSHIALAYTNIHSNTIYNIYVFSVDQVRFATAVMPSLAALANINLRCNTICNIYTLRVNHVLFAAAETLLLIALANINIRRNTIYTIYIFCVDQVCFAAAVMLSGCACKLQSSFSHLYWLQGFLFVPTALVTQEIVLTSTCPSLEVPLQSEGSA